MHARSRPLWALACAAGLLLTTLPLAQPALPATFTVDSTADLPDDNTNDSVCHTSAGTCTLRAAIQQATNASSNTVVVPAGTYPLSLGPLSISKGVTLIGADAATTIIDAGLLNRVLVVSLVGVGTVNISGVTIQNGAAGGMFGQGGGIFCCGPSGTVVNLTNIVVNNSTATGQAGGIFIVGGTLNVQNSTISNNTAPTEAGMHIGLGSTVTIQGTTINGNQATGTNGSGGGIASQGA